MTPVKLTQVQIDGFSGGNALPGEQVDILVRASLTSDQPEFYAYMDGIGNLVSGRAAAAGAVFFLDTISSLMLVVHADETADLYVDGPPRLMHMMAKRDVAAGEAVTRDKIADVRVVRFPDVPFEPSDKVVVCFKVGWKFALYFDLARDREFDVEGMEASLGHLYRVLMFQDSYEALSDQDQFGALMSAGWFPFIEIVGDEFAHLARAYKNQFDIAGQEKALLAKFADARIDELALRWWQRPALKDRRAILEPALEAYKRRDWVSCLKNLLTEIEGIIRDAHIVDVGASAPFKDLLKYAIDRGVKKSGGEASLFFPQQFLEYLESQTYGRFDPVAQTGVLDTRHGVSHGATKPEAYTQTRALQAILTVDQIGFYL